MYGSSLAGFRKKSSISWLLSLLIPLSLRTPSLFFHSSSNYSQGQNLTLHALLLKIRYIPPPPKGVWVGIKKLKLINIPPPYGVLMVFASACRVEVSFDEVTWLRVTHLWKTGQACINTCFPFISSSFGCWFHGIVCFKS